MRLAELSAEERAHYAAVLDEAADYMAAYGKTEGRAEDTRTGAVCFVGALTKVEALRGEHVNVCRVGSVVQHDILGGTCVVDFSDVHDQDTVVQMMRDAAIKIRPDETTGA
jgi:hypothetical protein